MGSEQRNALLAVVLSGLILFGWQYYFAPPKPAGGPIEPAVQTNTAPTGPQSTPAGPQAAGPIEPVAAETYELTGSNVAVKFTNSLAVEHFSNPQAAFKFENIAGSDRPLKVEFDLGQGFKTLSFAKTETANKFYNAENDITLTTGVDDKGVANFNLTSPKDFRYRLTFKSKELKLENGQERVFSYYTNELEHLSVGSEETGDKAIKWAGIDFNYHLFGLYFEKEPNLLFKNNVDGTFSLYPSKAAKSLNYNLIYVKKEYNYLSSLGNHLKHAVDFGIWGFFAEWILKGLQFFYTWFPNYGVSIILLTMLIRIITFPLQYKSFVSMKKLQLVQPELTKIREKYKEDPQRMQKESMELFKKSGANPIGGCLPLLLQMPVFFAFYKVLYSAVELVDAPFILWLHDLSNKDPYYVLPVLMTGAMFLQQKLTPNTISDPVQKKVMMFMPLVFGFIMKDLPSGLSLYIFVSTIFGILQQLIVFNAKSSPKPVVVA
ncbi:MAG TPA: membrane protein insertase YidC [Bacteriovoracaceae bacterium]|nr:membrane protein insertase YidC [Bacteriovoracaceae bacterium]